MGQCYHHLTYTDRYLLAHLYAKEKLPISKIAKVLGVHRATIYREINRNKRTAYVGKTTRKIWMYCPSHARDRYLARRKRGFKIDQYPTLQAYVHKRLIQGFSPWQIEWSLKYHDRRSSRSRGES
jgi:IS30 family transposase